MYRRVPCSFTHINYRPRSGETRARDRKTVRERPEMAEPNRPPGQRSLSDLGSLDSDSLMYITLWIWALAGCVGQLCCPRLVLRWGEGRVAAGDGHGQEGAGALLSSSLARWHRIHCLCTAAERHCWNRMCCLGLVLLWTGGRGGFGTSGVWSVRVWLRARHGWGQWARTGGPVGMGEGASLRQCFDFHFSKLENTPLGSFGQPQTHSDPVGGS